MAQNVSSNTPRRKRPASNLTWLLSAVCIALLSFLVPWRSLTQEPYQTTIISELGPQLSSDASIILSGEQEFVDVTRRWTNYRAPNFEAVVVVASEQDVINTVLYANAHRIPFLATSGKHGHFSTTQNLRNGIQIYLKQFNKIEVARTGDYATIRGGALVGDITAVLTAGGKRGVTGVCECVGIGGVTLGGGHGFLQGQYGLMADQLISARLVLANGTAIIVSAESHADLYWALRGAGHNFGIVTEIDYKVYDLKGHELWSYELFIFTGDQLEAFFETMNKMAATQPAQAVFFGFVLMNPAIDPINPVILMTVFYDGPPSELETYAAPLRQLQPRFHQQDQIPYHAMPRLLQSDKNGAGCQKGSWQVFGILLQTYNVQGMRRIYDSFNKKMQDRPAFNNSLFALESYSTQAVRAVNVNSTAFPHREYDILISPFIDYGHDSSLDDEAREWGEEMRRLALEGSGSDQMHTYVNYAHGSESLGAMYGYEPWRLDKLRRLKAEYDPLGRFNFYAPFQ